MTRMFAAAVLLVAALPSLASEPGQPRVLTFDDRVAAQRAIEEVYWRHRLWPRENPQQKPPLSAAIPDETIREKVRDYLRKSNALKEWWHRPITGAQLQAEMNRMARDTHDPSVLRELFEAVGNDAVIVAETLARQTLADRLVRGWYTTDDRWHGDVRRTAAAALAACKDVSCMKAMGGEYQETRATLGARDARAPGGMERVLDAEHWNRYLANLAARVGSSPETMSRPVMGPLEDRADAFVVTAVLSHRDGEVVTATTSWRKRPFDASWRAERIALSTAIENAVGPFVLPEVSATACTNDTWRPTHQDTPDMRIHHTAVWTGSEMIVWGGGLGPPDMNTGARYDPATDTWTTTSVGASVPSSRREHTAVWTGTEMIVWGGDYYDGAANATVYLNTGGRYDPATDRWMSISTGANVPAGRHAHTAVWTGNEMIVWGGATHDGLSNSGGRYDSASDQWLPTSAGANVPSGRMDHTAVWTGEQVIVWGGLGPGTTSGGRYDPAMDSWLAMDSGLDLLRGRSLHTAVWTGTEMIVWGGTTLFGPTTYLATGGRYDPVTDRWTDTSIGPGVPQGREYHTVVWTGSEMIVWGGVYYDSSAHYLNTGGRYDPATDHWVSSATTDAPTGRLLHEAVWTGEEMIVWGGFTPSTYPPGGRYSPSTDSWVPISTGGDVPAARWGHAAVWTGSEMIVWGGSDIDSARLDTGGLFLPSTDSWTPTSTGDGVPPADHGPAVVWTGTEMIVWGGFAAGTVTSSGARYDPVADHWRPTTGDGAPSARDGHAAVWTGREMIVWGGKQYDGVTNPPVNTGGRYDPAADRWTPTSIGANVPAARSGHSEVWTGTEMIVWGGNVGSLETNTGGRYDPSSDTWRSTSTGAFVPSTRSQQTAIWSGTSMIVWGGGRSGGSDTNTGGRYDPILDLWTATSTGANVPLNRKSHTAVSTGAEMIVWGGAPVPNVFSTGGRYDPANDHWTPTSTGENVPGGRYGATAVWTGSEMIVWGGILTSTGGVYCACPDGRIVYHDADGDGYGTPAESLPSCDGSIPASFVADDSDCDDSDPSIRPGSAEVCNGTDDDCDGLVDEDSVGEDPDGDGVGHLCENCPLVFNPSQWDFDHDGEGDLCDLDDGLILILFTDSNYVEWQEEAGFTSWNVYNGDLDVLKGTSVYTQLPGANALAQRHCGATVPRVDDFDQPPTGKTVFSLVAGVQNGVEGSLGQDSRGVERPNANPCP